MLLAIFKRGLLNNIYHIFGHYGARTMLIVSLCKMENGIKFMFEMIILSML